MKKLLAIVLVVVMALALGCAKQPAKPMRVAALKGPTGMGLAYLAEEHADRYAIELYDAPDAVTGKFINGEIDIAAVPINLAATLYNKTQGGVVMLAVNTLGVLYLIEIGDAVQSISDLAGRTVYATGEGSTPEYVLRYLLAQNDLTGEVAIDFAGEHAALAALLASGEAELGMLPEPNVSAVTLKNTGARVALDLNDAWEQASGVKLVQGCYIASRTFYEAHRKEIAAFLKDYAASVERVNGDAGAAALIAALGILPSEQIAASAIPRANIVCLTGEGMRAAAKAMLEVLCAANPKSVGGALPGDDLYAS